MEKYIDMSWIFLFRPITVAITKNTSCEAKIYKYIKPENSYVICFTIDISNFSKKIIL